MRVRAALKPTVVTVDTLRKRELRRRMAAMPAAEGLLPQQWLVPNEGGVVAADRLHRRAAEVLVAASSVQMETETDGLVEVWTISSDEGSIRASAPRVRVRDDMLMRCRLLIDGRPYLVMVNVADATGRSAERASITLNVIRVTLDVQERATHRFEFEVNATLTASVCDRIVPGEKLSAVVRDVSEGGMALIVSDHRPRPGDLYRLDVRLFEGAVQQDIRVRSVRTGGHGTKVLGCAFTAISPETVATVSGLLGRIDRPDDAPSVSVREVLGITVDGDSPDRSAQRYRSQAPKHTVLGMTRRGSEAPT
jgi:PilZ domain